MLDFRIQTFLAVCRHVSFTAAAEELHITQPAVSQHIHHLEEHYGVSLFSREGRHVALTPAGEVLLRTMQGLENDEQAMQRRMHEAGSGKRTLVFGVTMTIGEYAVVGALSRYLKAHPDTDLVVRFGNTRTLLDKLRLGEIDFALVEGYFVSSGFETLVDRSEPYLPVCASGHVFSGEVVGLEDLLCERLLVREEGSGTREILEKTLAAHHLRITDFAHVTEVGNVHALVSLLVQDCGVAFLYRAAVERELEQGLLRTIPIPGVDIRHDFTFLWNRESCFREEYKSTCLELRSLS